MKKINPAYLLLITLLFFSTYTFILKTIAYPGDGDCSDYHGITFIDVPIDSDAEIIVDGDPSEDFWTKSSNKQGAIEIILAETRIGEEIPELYRLNISFVMTNEDLLVLCQWTDNTTGFDFPPDQDGISFCWNINTPNFSAYYVTDMNTLHMGNGSVDAWRWYYQDIISPGEDHLCVDDCFNEDGWIDGNPEAKNINVAYSYKINSYTLEMKRRLITNEIYDVQFDEKKIYKFNIAILNNSHGVDHAVSWTYALDLRETEQIIPGLNLELFVFSLSIGIYLIYIIKIKKKSSI